MRKIEGLTVEEKGVLKVPLEMISVGGVTTIAELRRIDKVCGVIEDSEDGVIELEDADYQFLLQRFQTFQSWNPAVRSRILSVADKLGV